ncbi:MAG: carbonic anhydrase [Myxococcota bacterium]|nr:carbonic anhydrase [Myxococcota bacterium]
MDTTNISAAEALDRLRQGNQRFVDDARQSDAATQARRQALVAGQRPFAIVLACSDSRVPAELVFDQGLGDLFVVRVAGNVVAPSIVGSVEFAAATFGTPLVVVMGHTYCGAVDATLKAIQQGQQAPSDNIRDIVERIRPAAETVVSVGASLPRERLLDEAIRANVRNSVSHLRHGSRVLEDRVAKGLLQIVGAEYDLESGRVDIFDIAS